MSNDAQKKNPNLTTITLRKCEKNVFETLF